MIAQPETRTLHPNPTPECNLDDAAADDGPLPYEVSMVMAFRLMMIEDYDICENCNPPEDDTEKGPPTDDVEGPLEETDNATEPVEPAAGEETDTAVEADNS